jgi:F-type H+-transporting ATPase subunit epsilon
MADIFEDKASLQVEVVTPAKSAYSSVASGQRVTEVVLPGVMGQLGILPGHLPLLTALDVGPMIIRTDSGERTFYIDGGFAEVSRTKITVLTEDCRGVNELDVEGARALLEAAEKKLAHAEHHIDEHTEDSVLEQHRAEIKRAQMRLLLANEQHD